MASTGVVLIPTWKGGEAVAYAVVDAELFDWLNHWRWHLDHSGYAARSIRHKGKHRTQRMHRQIMELLPLDPTRVDHINQDKLDNRRSNLRIATHAENCQNVGSRAGTSKYRGVYFETWSGRWRANAMLDGVQHNLGRFDTEDEAGAASAEWRAEHMPFSAMDREAA